jgi:HSP20 family protein
MTKEADMWLAPIKLRRDDAYPLWRRLFDDFFETPYTLAREANGRTMVPALDLRETENAIVIETELPGVESKDLAVQLEDDMLVIRGERKHQQDERSKTMHSQEITYGAFERRVRLPYEVEPEKVDASFQHGILKITLPKKAGGRSRTTPIRIK